jgi:putative oxidoreductase|tara:strand:+ start:17674 stop:18132 length:459 start_codon:yes stop_codon:yes gene_type:complete
MTDIAAKLTDRLSGAVPEGIALLFTRVALAGIFWRSARTKVEEGSFLTIRDTTFYQFSDAPFNQVPILNGDLGAYVTTYMEHLLPILLLFGLATRLGALGVLGMTIVIQIFVFPEMAVWWQTHILWVALALVLIVRGGGLFSLDRLTGHRLG